MKLDRNINPDGKGKYGLIKIRECEEDCFAALVSVEGAPHTYVSVNGDSVDLGTGCPFFVIKYKDRFAAPALRAYAKAIRDEADELIRRFGSRNAPEAHGDREELLEFAVEIEREAEIAERWPTKQIPN